MLKPKKKITRKEIHKDPFLENIGKGKVYFDENKQLIIKLGLGLVIILFVGFIMNKNSVSEKTNADTSLGIALVNLSIGDKENALLQMEIMIDEYSGTDASRRTLFLLGKNFYGQKDYIRAASYLEEFLDNPINKLKHSAHLLLGDIEFLDGNYGSAEKHYKVAIDDGLTKPKREKNTLNLAKFYILQSRPDDARALLLPLYDQLENGSQLINEADEIWGHLHTFASVEE